MGASLEAAPQACALSHPISAYRVGIDCIGATAPRAELEWKCIISDLASSRCGLDLRLRPSPLNFFGFFCYCPSLRPGLGRLCSPLCSGSVGWSLVRGVGRLALGCRPRPFWPLLGLGAVSPGAPSAGWVGVAPRCRAGRVSRVGWLYGRRALADLRWPFQRKGIPIRRRDPPGRSKPTEPAPARG